MGRFDSSLTRVVPVFDHLLASTVDPSWLARLLALPEGGSPRGALDVGERIVDHGWGPREKALPAPISLLRHLVEQAAGGRRISAGQPEMRRRLFAGDSTARDEALRLLQQGAAGRGWHVLEGASKPDAYLETDRLIIVIEGKRTEPGPTTHTTWMPVRHQMLRHLDAAREHGQGKTVVGFFIVEGDRADRAPDTWVQAAVDTISAGALTASLPHRSADVRGQIAAGFLGVTTWQRLCSEFGIRFDSLPDSVLRPPKA
jgi:hypothetical protein